MQPILSDTIYQSKAYAYSKDLAGHYTQFNPDLCALFGLTIAEVAGKRDHDLLDSAYADELRRIDLEVIESRQPHWSEQSFVAPGASETTYLWTLKTPSIDSEQRVIGVNGVIIDITAYKRQEQELIATQSQLSATLQAVPDLIFEFDQAGTYLSCHASKPELLVKANENLLGRRVTDVLPGEAANTIMATIAEACSSGRSKGRQIHLDLKDGSRWFELSASLKSSPHADDARVILLSRDITKLRTTIAALEERESLLRAVVDNTPVEYWARDLEGNCILENALVVKHWGSLLGSRPQEAAIPQEIINHWQENNRRAYAGEVVDAEVSYKVNGEDNVFQNVVAPIRKDGKIVGIVGFNQDITERKQADERIRNLAFYDPLTQLPNRRLMFDRLNQALVGSGRRGRQGALMLIDLDNFKILNDTQGHELGDRLLLEVAARLRASMRQGDTAARLGGDEFVVILEDIDGLNQGASQGAIQAEALGEQIQLCLSQPFRLPSPASGLDFLHRCTCSIGVTLFSGVEVSAEELLRRCDTAMYQAKAAGRNAVRFFDPQMQAAVAARAALEADLRDAIEQQQFLVYYQVQVDHNGQPIGAEALLRWQHPTQGMIYPGAFIGLAEETGLIVALGDWVLEAACRQLAIWRQHPATAHLTLAVNVSARQFRTENFIQKLKFLIADTGIAPGQLKLELTETLLIENTGEIVAAMEALKDLGVSFSLDDFGTGYSSLAYLKQLPLDQLKIDQSFVRDILTDNNDAVIARTILVLGDSLGMQVIAEGVETREQWQFLADSGCQKFQGYYFGRPEPLATLERRFFGNA